MSDDAAQQRRDLLERWDAASAGWGRAQRWWSARTASVSHAMVDALALQPGQRVLELAGGPGETGFLAAELIAPSGTLICSDQSEAMLALARARAAELGLANVEFRVVNGESIDLPVASLDAALCRFGYMLMIDPDAALIETRRILRPRGRVSLAVWAAPERNPWLAVPSVVFIEHGLAEPVAPGAPGAFALADPDRLRGMLEDAGFDDIHVETVDLDLGMPTFEQWWDTFLDINPTGPAVRAADPDLARAIATQVAERLDGRYAGSALVALAEA